MDAGGEANVSVAVVAVTPVAGLVPELTVTGDVSEVQVALVPLKTVTEYGGVPPAQLTMADIVTPCPTSVVEGERLREMTVRGAVTVTVALAQAVPGPVGVPVLLSVTVTE